MTTQPEIAIIEPNTLSSLGLKSILEEIIPMATIRTFHQMCIRDRSHCLRDFPRADLCTYQEYESRSGDHRLHTDYFYREYRIVSRKYRTGQRVFGVYSSFCERNAYTCVADRAY